MSESKIVPICAITDERLSFTVPALFISIMENSSKNNFYKFYCFVNGAVSAEDRKKILSTQALYSNCSINIVDMGKTYQDCINRHPTVTNACLYKFAIIKKLIQYDKVIYLDTDIVVNGDISELYDIDLNDNYIGGVFNILYYTQKKNLPAMLKIPDIESYINAGVMLMNLKKMREDNVVKKLEHYIGQFEGSVDQHIFNKVCYGKILNIPPKYNMTMSYQDLYQLPESEAFYRKKELREAIDDPMIIHYTGERKPWTYANLPLAWKWYKYFRKSAFRDYTLERVPFNLKRKAPLGFVIQNQLLSLGARFNDLFRLNIDYYQFFSIVKLVKQRNISPICFIIKSAKNSVENKNLLDLISELKNKGRVVFVLSAAGGSLTSEFKKTAHYFFKIKKIDFRIAKALKIFQHIILSEIDCNKSAQDLTLIGMSYLWLIQDLDKKEKFIKKNSVVSELVNESKNVIEGFDLKKVMDILCR